MHIRIRTATPADAGPIARVQVDSWRTTYAGIVPAGYLDNLSYGERESWWARVLATYYPATSTFVAETEGGDVVGFARGGPERDGNRTYPGELYAVYLLEGAQRQGIGRGLVAAVAHGLLTEGFGAMLVWVLEANHAACRFCESLAGDRIGQRTIPIGGTDFLGVSYGWRDITALTVEHNPTAEVRHEHSD